MVTATIQRPNAATYTSNTEVYTSKKVLPFSLPNALYAFNTEGVKSSSANKAFKFADVVAAIQSPSKHLLPLFAAIKEVARLHYNETDASRKAQLKTQLDALKVQLPFFIPSGYRKRGHGNADLFLNGTVQIDIDFHHTGGDIQAKQQKHFIKLIASALPFVQLAAISPTDYGLKIWLKTDLSVDATNDLYKFAQKQITEFLSQVLNVETRYFDALPIGKTCYLPFDPSLYFNDNATAFKVDIERFIAEKEAEREKEALRQANIKRYDTEGGNVTAAAQFLIDNQINITESYSEYVATIGACIHAFDIETAETIARQLCQASAKFNEKDFLRTFNNLLRSKTPEKAATAASLVYYALQNGFVKSKNLSDVLATADLKKELSDYKLNNRDLFIIERSKALQHIAMLKGEKIVICEESFIETAQNAIKTATVCTFKDISKLSMEENVNVYVFGSQNLNRKYYVNATNEVEKLAKRVNVVLFSDTPTFLNLAQHITIIDKPTQKAQIIVSDNPTATFVELLKECSEEHVLFLDTHESVCKQLEGFERVKRSELYAADHNKPLFVLYDNAVELLPESFSQFKNVVFVASSEVKECVYMSTFCDATAKMTRDALEMVDNVIFKGEIEKMYFETVKGGKLPIRHNGQTWERCPNTEGVLENSHQVKFLVSDVSELKKRVESFATIHTKTAEISEATAEIVADIKQAKIDIAIEKKTEFAEFLENVETANVQSLNDLKEYVGKQDVMSRGAKIAYSRLKILLKLNPNFSTCFEAVKDYVGWTKTRGRFCAAKIIKTTTKTGTALQTFRDTTEGNTYSKTELLEIAKAILKVNNNDTMAWKELKRTCHLPNKQVMKDGNRERLYEAIFLE
jgi:hypothetical protein